MQHSRKKRAQQPPTEEEVKKQEQRLKAILKMHGAVLQAMREENYTAEALDLTTKCMTLSPDFYTVFNFRRKILQTLLAGVEDKGQLLSKELDTLTKVIRENSKSYTLWFHRQWVILLCREFEPLMKKELALCDKMLAADQRNFHVWNYRSWLVKVAKTQTSEEELAFTTTLIYRDFSNYSAWHYRSKVVQELYGKSLPDDFVSSELTTLKHAMYTSPGDQSIWTYHQWLVSQLIPIQVASVRRTPTGLVVGFTHSVASVSDLAVAVANEWIAVQGTWKAESASEFSYIWTFELSERTDDALELRTNGENTSLHDSTGLHKLARKVVKVLASGQCEESGDADNPLILSELQSIEELLEIEDTHRAAALLRQAQLYESLSFYCVGAERLSVALGKVVSSYRELVSLDPSRTPFYQENLSVAECRLSGLTSTAVCAAPKSQRLSAQVLALTA